MKNLLLTLLSTLTLAASAFAHGDVELGPNGGHLLEFSKNESLHGEVILKDGKFQIGLLDKEHKPVALTAQQLTATSADRDKPQKFSVEILDGKFVVPAVKEGDWIIFQFKEAATAKPVTARMHYDTKTCSACKEPEWLCKCAQNEDKKK